MNYKEIKLEGIWKEGYALDIHTTNSTYIGEDACGHPRFDTSYSEVGMCIKKLKYQGDISKIDPLVDISTDFLLNKWKIINEIDLIIPAPPSKPREKQPVFLLVEKIAEKLGKPYCLDYFEKLNDIEVKNLTFEEKRSRIQLKKNKILKKEANILLIDDLYDSGVTLNLMCEQLLKEEANILLIDDLYDSGATLNLMCEQLLKEEYIGNIYVLTMTKTRKG